MNTFIWITVIVAGMAFAAIGFVALATPGGDAAPVMFLLTGGLAACLVGLTGVTGCMAWIPGLAGAQDTGSGLKK